MKRELLITADPIDEATQARSRQASAKGGAVVQFLGIVRDSEAGQAIQAIDYEAFREMAEHQFNLLFDQVEAQWPVESLRLIHRVGRVRAGEPSLWVEVTTPHRGEAFQACQWLIDEMKKRVPIWKKPLP